MPAGTALHSSGSVTVTKPGTVLSGVDISGTVYVDASNVTIERSRITGSAFALIQVSNKATDVVISDVELNGLGTRGGEGSDGVIGPATVLRANIYGVENGVVPSSGSLVQDSYIHDLNAPGAPHYDGIQIDGKVSNVTLRHNTIINPHGQTSAVMIDDYFGPTTNITVVDNQLTGGGYTIYADGSFNNGAITGITFTGNHLGKGDYGYTVIRNSSVTWTNNTDATTGKIVPA